MVVDIQILHCGKKPVSQFTQNEDYPYLLKQALADKAFTFSKVWTVFENDFPSDVRCADVWLLTGSPASAYEQHEWILRLLDFIEDTYEADVPMVGVCFGHQAIATAMGGLVKKYAGGWILGVNTYAFNDCAPINAFAYHQDQVVEKPPAASVIAYNAATRYAGLRYGDCALTFQFHPEIVGTSMHDIFEDRSVPQYATARARQTIREPTSHVKLLNYIKDFIKHAYKLQSPC